MGDRDIAILFLVIGAVCAGLLLVFAAHGAFEHRDCPNCVTIF